MQTYRAYGSHGSITFDTFTGVVVAREACTPDCDGCNGKGYGDVLTVNVAALDPSHGPEFDILTVAYWTHGGTYVPVDTAFLNWRKANAS